MYSDEKFMIERAEAHKIMKIKEESILKKWLKEIKVEDEPIGYYADLSNNVMEIYTNHPGQLIGKGGIGYESLKNILNEEFGREWNVKFIEVRGGFICNCLNHQTAKLYFVSSIVNNKGDLRPWLLASASGHLTLEEAKEELSIMKSKFVVLSAWIDALYDDGTTSTIFHECYINGFGVIG